MRRDTVRSGLANNEISTHGYFPDMKYSNNSSHILELVALDNKHSQEECKEDKMMFMKVGLLRREVNVRTFL